MFNDIGLQREFFEALAQIDEKIVDQIAAGRCPVCGGPLHRSDFARKPRGALMAAAGEAFVTRFSLCCGRDGCRKRATPPSLRFLGRRVYLGAVVILASVIAQHDTIDKARASGSRVRPEARAWNVGTHRLSCRRRSS